MLQLSIAGRLGRDAEYRTTQGGDALCSFSVAADVGFGDRKQTIWVDVTRWGKGAEGLSKHLRKGTSVAVTGEMSTREHEGKTYLQCRADRVTLLGGGESGQGSSRREERGQRQQQDTGGSWGSNAADLDDDIPF